MIQDSTLFFTTNSRFFLFFFGPQIMFCWTHDLRQLVDYLLIFTLNAYLTLITYSLCIKLFSGNKRTFLTFTSRNRTWICFLLFLREAKKIIATPYDPLWLYYYDSLKDRIRIRWFSGIKCETKRIWLCYIIHNIMQLKSDRLKGGVPMWKMKTYLGC